MNGNGLNEIDRNEKGIDHEIPFRRKEGRSDAQRMQIRGNALPLLTFPQFEEADWLCHGMTTRLGGISGDMWTSLNLSFTRGDEEAAVRENFRRVAAELGVAEDRFVFARQTHTTNVRVVTEADAGKGLTRPQDDVEVDGQITNVPGLVLSIFTADCVPLFFADPVHRAIGLSHSGWKGTAGRIGAKTLQRMQEEYGTDPADVLCGIAPSICQDCYEVSRDVAEVFAAEFAGREAEVLKKGRAEDKFQLDLWAANRIIAEEAGVRPEQIVVTDVCTCCNSDLLFSHRASHGRRGNLGAFLMIRE